MIIYMSKKFHMTLEILEFCLLKLLYDDGWKSLILLPQKTLHGMEKLLELTASMVSNNFNTETPRLPIMTAHLNLFLKNPHSNLKEIYLEAKPKAR